MNIENLTRIHIPYKYSLKRLVDWFDKRNHDRNRYIRDNHKKWTYERRFFKNKNQLIGWQKRCRLCDHLFEEAVLVDGKYIGENYNLKKKSGKE